MSETETFREYAFLTKEDVTNGLIPQLDMRSFVVVGGCYETLKPPYRTNVDK